LAELRRRWFSS